MKKASKWLALMLAIVMIASVGFVGCVGGTNDDQQEPAGENTDNNADTPAAEASQELHWAIGAEPPSLDAQLSTDAVSFEVLNAVMEGLVRVGPDGIVPGMAESWDIVDDGNKYVFHLNKDAKWSNGDPVTVQNFVDAWERAINAHNASQYYFMITDYVKGAKEYYDWTNYEVLKDMYENNRAKYEEEYKNEEDGTVPTPDVVAFGEAVENPQPVSLDSVGFKAVDESTLEVELIQPTPWFLEMTAFATYLPINKAFYDAHKDTYASEKDQLLYNGPWVISDWSHESKIVLTKNDQYWDKDSIKLDTITLDIIKEVTTALTLYEAGDIDRTGLSRENVPLYKDDPNFGTFGEMVHFYLVFNTTKKPYNNEKVRKALYMALDTQAYVDTVLNNGSEAGVGLVPNGFDAYAGAGKTFRDVSAEKYGKLVPDYNPEEAKKLLEEGLNEEGMSLKDFSVEFLSGDSETARKSSEFIKTMWSQGLGIEVSTPGVPFAERLNRSRTQQFDIVMSGWGPDYNDPLTWLFLFETDGPYNDGKWSNPEYDQLVEKAKVELDQEKRLQYFIDAEKILMDEVGIAPVYYRNTAYLMQPYVKGLVEKAFGSDFEFKWTYIEGK